MTKANTTATARKTPVAKATTAKKPAVKAPAKKPSPATATGEPLTQGAEAKVKRAFFTSALLAAQAAKDTPKSAVLRTAAGFYTGSKRAGVKAGAEFIGRVASVLPART